MAASTMIPERRTRRVLNITKLINKLTVWRPMIPERRTRRVLNITKLINKLTVWRPAR